MPKALTVTIMLFSISASFYLLPSPLLTLMHHGFVTGYLFTVDIFVLVCVSHVVYMYA
jgi:hypothetical protein